MSAGDRMEPLFDSRDLVILDRLLAEWPRHSGDHAMDVVELRTKVRRALAALDEGRTGEWESDAT